jgi:hypothetical protein
MTTPRRDARLPQNVRDATPGIHTQYDRHMDAMFEAHCVRCKRFYFVYIFIDILLIAYTYKIGHLALVWFSLISICCIFVHFLLILFLPTSGRKKRVFDVARMANYDAFRRCQSDSLTPLRRFALLSRNLFMQQWHFLMMTDIALPTMLSILIASIYFLLSLKDAVFLFVYLLSRGYIALCQYHTLATFYDRAVSDSFNSVIKNHDIGLIYARSRSSELINATLQRADDHLKYIATRHSDPALLKARAQKRLSQQQHKNTFSGVAIDTVAPERVVVSRISHI